MQSEADHFYSSVSSVSPIPEYPRKLLREPFTLGRTPLNIGQETSVVRTSEDLGWSDLNATTVMGRRHDHEIMHKATPDLWINMALTPVDVTWGVNVRRAERLIRPENWLSLLAPGTPATMTRNSETCGFHLFVKDEVLEEVAGELFGAEARKLEIATNFGFEDHNVSGMLEVIRRAMSDPPGTSDLKVEYIARAVVAEIFQKYSAFGGRDTEREISGGLSARQIRQIDEYVDKHLSSRILLNDLAAVAGISRTLLIHRFKASFRQTPHQHLMERRLRRACRLLVETSLSITEIANTCGFSDHAHLSTSFKRGFGKTPISFRRDSR